MRTEIHLQIINWWKYIYYTYVLNRYVVKYVLLIKKNNENPGDTTLGSKGGFPAPITDELTIQ